MALIRPTVTPFPIIAPPAPSSSFVDTASMTEVRFSRWNNANAEKFIRHQRTQKEIEDDLRRYRRYQSALSIANLPTTPRPPPENSGFKSIGTPSSPSPPSIPGKRSKYSKTLNPSTKSLVTTHPAFRKLKMKPIPTKERVGEDEEREVVDVKVGEEGVSYVVPGAPFEYMYSYTETPKSKPVAFRELPITPFGPETMPRPWTGRKPLPPSKKKLPEFDSFLAPPAKKGMKPVQRPGPFLPGSGPKYVWSRGEVLGEPLTKEEVTELIEGCRKSKRQLNMGRDGLTHNMLDNIHAHWKRRRVCKIKCKGVCTVDMDNVSQQLEEKTGGKIIYRRGGVVFLFRGRNYNYKTRPRFPLMLWKPVTPVYPRLIKRIPDGLTLEEATEMRKKGRDVTPICKLAKNGVYVNLVANVREAFEACELVRVDCQGLNPSDYRKIGAKLKDLVSCVLVSFENEHILMWRGREWKSSFSVDENGNNDAISTISENSGVSSSDDEEIPSSSSSEIPSPEMSVESSDSTIVVTVGTEAGYPAADDEEASPSCSGEVSKQETSIEESDSSAHLIRGENIGIVGDEGSSFEEDEELFLFDNREDVSIMGPSAQDDTNLLAENGISSKDDTSIMPSVSAFMAEGIQNTNHGLEASTTDRETNDETPGMSNSYENSGPTDLESPYMQDVLLLFRQAVQSGNAIVLADSVVDADTVYERSVSFAQVAPPGPVFRHRPRKVRVNNSKNQETMEEEEVEEAVPVVERKAKEHARNRNRGKTRTVKGFPGDYGVIPQGSLGVDELAKLLA